MKSAIKTVVEENELQLSSLRRDNLKQGGKRILELIEEGGEVEQLFIDFSTKLATAVRSTFRCSTTYRSSATKREKLWSAFHQLRFSELPTLWKDFLSSIEVDYDDQLLQQSVNQKLFEKVLPEHFPSAADRSPGDEEPLGKDELNALQYACGYIPHALLKRYEKSTGSKFDKFIECLGDMAVRSECNSENLLDYTKEWIDRVNRGGLFPLNDATYRFFVSVEKETRTILPSHMTKTQVSADSFKRDVIQKIMRSRNIQWHWTLISQSIDSEEEAIELLKEIVTLWVTVRGFSITATWMEIFKQEKKKTTKKKRGLRKQLSRSDQ